MATKKPAKSGGKGFANDFDPDQDAKIDALQKKYFGGKAAKAPPKRKAAK